MSWAKLATRTRVVRILWCVTAWNVVRLLWCRSFRVDGTIPHGPVVFAANHSSHVDTVMLELALMRHGHTKVVAAAADDYFFTRLWRALPVAVTVGAIPFPRHGRVGLDRAEALLADGWSVILFPQGTRDGGPFRTGIGHLLANGATVVPVTIRGTDRLLPKGARLPRRAPVSVVLGEPIVARPSESAEDLTRRVELAVGELL